MSFFTLPIFTRLLSVENFGIVSIYNTWLSILSIFICFQSHGSIGIARINYPKEKFNKYISNITLFSTVVFIFWLFSFNFFKEKISMLINLPINIIWIMLIQSFFGTIVTLKTTIYLFEQKAKENILVSFINLFFNIIFSIILIRYIYYSETYLGRIIGGAIPTILIGMYYYCLIIRAEIPKINIQDWKFCMALTTPIIFHALSHIILGNSDRLMLEKFRGFYETGLYSLIYNFGMIISMIWGALNSAWVPWYYENMKKSNHELIKKYSRNYLSFFTIICIGFLMLSPEVIRLMAPEKYWDGLNFLPFIVLGAYFNFLYSFSVNYEFYSKKTKYIAMATTGAATINFFLNLYFIPKFGSIGAAITTVVAYFCMFLFHETITRIKFEYRILTKLEYFKELMIVVFYIGIYYLFLENVVFRIIFLIIYLINVGQKLYKQNLNKVVNL